MSEPAIGTAAEMVVSARIAGNRLGPFDDALGIQATLDAYRVQQIANDRIERQLGPRSGHKIGGTSAAMRAYLGHDEPLAGEVFASTVHASGASLNLAAFRRPGIETEIAVRIGHDLRHRDHPYTADEVAAVVEAMMPAIEIVDDRYTDHRGVGVPVVIADNAFNAGSVLGRPTADWRALDRSALTARTWIDGRLVAEGRSDALMGDPLAALVWLVERRRSLGLGLEAGSFVSLGTITPVQWLSGPCGIRIEIEGLGEVVVQLR